MTQVVTKIGIIEPSDLIYEGLTNILLKNNSHIRFFRIDDLENICRSLPPSDMNIIILNITLTSNRLKVFRNIKRERPGIAWVGLIYSFTNAETLSEFDEIIRIDEETDILCTKISRLADNKSNHNHAPLQKTLTERETDVLKYLSRGLSNKEIADSLNISIHTVISHRKNISLKTGIKSQSGLTIYAISNNIISIDSI